MLGKDLTIKEASIILDKIADIEGSRIEDPDGFIGKVTETSVTIFITVDDGDSSWYIRNEKLKNVKILPKEYEKDKYYKYRHKLEDGCVFREPDGEEWLVEDVDRCREHHIEYYDCRNIKDGTKKQFTDRGHNEGYFNVIKKAQKCFKGI